MLRWAWLYQQKQAAKPEINLVKKIVRNSIEDLFKKFPLVMDGLVYVSHVTMPAEQTIAFTLNLDKNKQETINKHKEKRDKLINLAVKSSLKENFQKDFDLGFQEILV